MLDFYYGDISIETILSLDAVKDGGFDEDSIALVCEQIGLISLQKDISAIDIAKHFLPCIIFDENNTPLIYKKNIANKKIELYDATEKKVLDVEYDSLKKFNRTLLIFREQEKRDIADVKANNEWFWEPVKSFWRSYVEIGLLTFFINLFAILTPLFTMIVYDRVVPNQAYETLFVLSIGLVIFLIFELIFKSIRNHIIDKTAKKLSLYLEEDLMKRVIGLQSQFDTMMTGTKANLFRELAVVRDFFATKSLVQIIDFPFFIFALIAIYAISPAVAVVPLFIAVVVILLNIALQAPIAKLSKRHLENMQSKHNFLVEAIQGSDIIKLSNATPSRLYNWRSLIAYAENVQMKIQTVNAFALNSSQTLIQFTTILTIIVGVYQIADKELSVGGLIAITILAGRAMVPVISLSTMIIKFKEIKDSLYNLKDFWHLPLETQKNIEIGLGELKGEMEFKNVSYFYKNAKYPSLDNITFKINPCEKIGIIGQTGSGKSTILKLITGLLHPSSGSIFIDNHDISTLHPIELRQNIGVMTQEPFLFNGTLKENIELSKPISKERMMELIMLTGLEDLVKKSGQGDGLIVGERGANLSVGQRHLVGLARAIANNPNILILDEPTTGLDVGLERKLMDSLKNIIADKTLILITHRFAALELVDRIIVMNNGKIVADGPRDAVLNALKNQTQGRK